MRIGCFVAEEKSKQQPNGRNSSSLAGSKLHCSQCQYIDSSTCLNLATSLTPFDFTSCPLLTDAVPFDAAHLIRKDDLVDLVGVVVAQLLRAATEVEHGEPDARGDVEGEADDQADSQHLVVVEPGADLV